MNDSRETEPRETLTHAGPSVLDGSTGSRTRPVVSKQEVAGELHENAAGGMMSAHLPSRIRRMLLGSMTRSSSPCDRQLGASEPGAQACRKTGTCDSSLQVLEWRPGWLPLEADRATWMARHCVLQQRVPGSAGARGGHRGNSCGCHSSREKEWKES